MPGLDEGLVEEETGQEWRNLHLAKGDAVSGEY
jgi:hypothetical protein